MKSEKRKNNFTMILFFILIYAVICICICIYTLKLKNNKEEKNNIIDNTSSSLEKLPLPETTGGSRGLLGIDKNINEINIDQYLGRSDSVYRDMRMLKDPGNYEAIGGESFLTGYIDGFEVVSYPYLAPVTDLPDEVGETYRGETLFNIVSENTYVANYEESLSIMEKLFPKDKYIFLMCGGGGYSGMTKDLLVALGWDANKIYNIGGYWYYAGNKEVKVKKTIDGETVYDFDSVPYHEIDFTKLTKISDEKEKKRYVLDECYLNSKKKEESNIKEKSDAVFNQNVEKVVLDEIYYGKTEDQEFDIELNTENMEEDDVLKEEFDQKKANIINQLLENKASFVILVEKSCKCRNSIGYNVANTASVVLTEYGIYSYKIDKDVLEKTKLYETVKYTPTVIVIKEGEIIAFIDENIELFENDQQLQKWLKTYVEIQ